MDARGDRRILPASPCNLFISHSMPLVRRLRTRIAVMEKGRLVETGEAEAVCAAPREAYTRQLLQATPE